MDGDGGAAATQAEIRRVLPALRARALHPTCQWLSEFLVAAGDSVMHADGGAPSRTASTEPAMTSLAITDVAELARSLIEGREFERAAHLLERAHGPPSPNITVVITPAAATTTDGSGGSATSDESSGGVEAVGLESEAATAPSSSAAPAWPLLDLSLWGYALLMAGERHLHESRLAGAAAASASGGTADLTSRGARGSENNPHCRAVTATLLPLLAKHQLDPPAAMVCGCAARRAGQPTAARAALTAAVRGLPLLWGAWAELAECITDVDDIPLLPKDHWTYFMFLACVMRGLGRLAESLAATRAVIERWPHLASAGPLRRDMGLTLHNMRCLEPARQVLLAVHRDDPYCVTGMDTLSDVLFVEERSAELASLARHAFSVAKYKPETSCIVANLYSLRGEHERAILFFKRALRADPSRSIIWTLLGHELLETKNTAAAIESYRRALDLNVRDYRAWYGLGQAHEILSMHLVAVDAYRRAAMLRPFDGRMWTALGGSLESVGMIDECASCLYRAASCPMGDGIAQLRLAVLAETGQFGDRNDAIAWYRAFLDHVSDNGIYNPSGVAAGNLFLGQVALEAGDAAQAAMHAATVLATPGIEEAHAAEATALQRSAQTLRAVQARGSVSAGGEEGDDDNDDDVSAAAAQLYVESSIPSSTKRLSRTHQPRDTTAGDDEDDDEAMDEDDA